MNKRQILLGALALAAVCALAAGLLFNVLREPPSTPSAPKQEADALTGAPAPERALQRHLSGPPAALLPAAPPGDRFTHHPAGPLRSAAQHPVSAFAVDVDTASYAYVRARLNAGELPPPDAVRIEEFVNYFDYGYPAPDGDDFAIDAEVFPTPWNPDTTLLRIGLQARDAPAEERAAACASSA